MTDKERLITFRKSREAQDFEGILEQHLPLVISTISAQVTEPAAVQEITASVFQTLAYRCRRISKSTYLPGWLVRTATYAANQWHKEQKDRSNPAKPTRLTLLALNDLPPKLSDALVAFSLHGSDLEKAAQALGGKVKRISKRIAKGQKKLLKRSIKRGVSRDETSELTTLGFISGVPPHVSEWDIPALASDSVKTTALPDLVQKTIKSWSWFFWKRRIKRCAIALGCLILLIASLAAAFAVAWETGHFMAWMIKLQAGQAIKEAPELALPPSEWDGEGLQAESIEARSDIFGPTNIWRVDFTFTPEQWAGIAPKKIKPVKIFSNDGKIVLRNPNAKRSGLAGVLGIEFEWTKANLEFGGISFTNISTRYRGNGTYVNSLYGSKQSIKIDLNKSISAQKIAGIDRFNFNNLVEDATFMHDNLGYAVFRASGIAAPRTAYAWITIQITDQERKPNGFYVLLENIDKRFAKDRFGSSKTPIFKPVTPYLFKYLGDDWDDYAAIYDLKTEATKKQTQQVIDFARSLSNDSDEAFAETIDSYLDLDQFSRYLASIVLIASYDGFLSNGQNFYMYLDPETNLFGFIPWDLDHGWGDFPFVGSASDRDQASIWKPWAGDHLLLERVMKVEAFRKLYRQQLESLLATEFRSDVLGPRIDAIAQVNQEPVKQDNPFRYRRFVEAVGDDWGAPPLNSDSVIRPVNPIKRFIAARSASVRDQLEGKSEGVIPKAMMGPPTEE